MSNTGYWLFDFLQNHFTWILSLLDVSHMWPGGPEITLLGFLKAILIAPLTMITLLLPVLFIISTLTWIVKCWIGRPFLNDD